LIDGAVVSVYGNDTDGNITILRLDKLGDRETVRDDFDKVDGGKQC
jgi:hypothetical protein